MGYRHYLYKVEKSLIEKIRACKTNKEFVSLFKDLCEDDEEYVPVYELGKKLFEFGKYYENADEMYKHGNNLFNSEELNEMYSDYGAIILEKSGLLCAIEWQRKKLINLYEDLLKEKSSNEFDDRAQFERLHEHARDYLRWWQFGACNLSENSEHLASSWLYEHTIFDLVRILKTFDWENNCLMFMGW